MVDPSAASSPRRHRSILLAATASVALSVALVGPVSLAQDKASPLEVATSGDLGSFLTGTGGMTLYFFTKDASPGASVCDGKCAENWPPYVVKDDAPLTPGAGVSGVVGTFKRADGARQATYDGRPLYYFAKDTKAGDTNGQAVGDVWFVAAVDGSVPTEDYPIATATSDLGTFLTGKDGMALYFFAKDTTPGVSACTDKDCLDEWPPYLLAPDERLVPTADVTGVLATTTRPDGGAQVTYDGRPLYYFKDDSSAGTATGQGVDEFVVALVDGTISKASPAPSGSPAS